MSFYTEAKKSFTDKAQVVVVGSGAGGALAALTLAEAGFDVLVLEQGHAHAAPYFPENISGAITSMYAEGGFRTMNGAPPIPVAGGEVLGGSTVVNSAICFRTPDVVRQEWDETTGGLVPYDEYYSAMDEVEAILHVGTTPDHLLSGLDQAHKEAAEKLGWSNHNFRRNTPTCVGCGRCNTGCVVGGKWSVDKAALPRVAKAGGRIRAGCRVTKLEPGRIEGIVRSRDDQELGAFSVTAERIILSGGSILTPRLLLDSGVVDTSGEVGRGLAVHPVFSVMGFRADRPVVSPGSTQGHYIDQFDDEWVLLESNPTLVGAIFQSLPVHGREALELMSKGAHFSNTGAMIRDSSRGRVMSSRGAGARVKYSLNEEDRRKAIRGMRIASQLWLEGMGADFVVPAMFTGRMIRSVDDLDRELPEDLPVGHLAGYSSHPQASCSLGRCLDATGQLHELPGVHVMDASALPSNVGRNPQISVMTMSRMLAARLAASLGKPARPLWDGGGPVPPPPPQHGVPCGLDRGAPTRQVFSIGEQPRPAATEGP